MSPQNSSLRRLTMINGGTTGQGIGNPFEELCDADFGAWPVGHWRSTTIETARTLPPDRPGRTNAAIGEDLTRFDVGRMLHAPQWVREAPRGAWNDLATGAGKWPLSARIAVWLFESRIQAALDSGWPTGAASDAHTRRFLHNNPGIQLLNEDLWLITGASGGSTAPAVILWAVKQAFNAPNSPQIAVVLAGPRCGPSHDGYVTEQRNFLCLLASLQLLQHDERNGRRLWVFTTDGPAADRESVLQGAAELCFRLAVTHPGQLDFTRYLRDGFNLAANRGLPAICHVNYRRLTTDARGQRARALDQLAEALGFGDAAPSV